MADIDRAPVRRGHGRLVARAFCVISHEVFPPTTRPECSPCKTAVNTQQYVAGYREIGEPAPWCQPGDASPVLPSRLPRPLRTRPRNQRDAVQTQRSSIDKQIFLQRSCVADYLGADRTVNRTASQAGTGCLRATNASGQPRSTALRRRGRGKRTGGRKHLLAWARRVSNLSIVDREAQMRTEMVSRDGSSKHAG
jgi:hypothetical protein